jgi:hypothetical protein
MSLGCGEAGGCQDAAFCIAFVNSLKEGNLKIERKENE